MHTHGLLHPDHPDTWDIGTVCHRLVSENGLVVWEVSPPLLSVFLVVVSEVAPPLSNLGLPIPLIPVLVSAKYLTARPPVHPGCLVATVIRMGVVFAV